jgi:hypothetical protein
VKPQGLPAPCPRPTRCVLLMLASVVLFASNALRGRAVVGLAVVFGLFGFGRGLRPAGIFNNRPVSLTPSRVRAGRFRSASARR